MVPSHQIINLIEKSYENEFLDFKKVQYSKDYRDLIIDVMSMANSDYEGDKFIIIGVKDSAGEDRNICGIQPNEFKDASEYQNILLANITPEVKIDYYPFDYNGKIIGILQVHSSNTDRPYMLKKKYSTLEEGTCRIRKGCNNKFATRADFDRFYKVRESLDVRFMEKGIMASYTDKECARTSISIRNLTNRPVTFMWGELTIFDCNGLELTSHQVYGFEKFVGADFKLSILPMEEKYGDLYVGLGSGQCVILGLDEYGCGNQKYNMELCFKDTLEQEYKTSIEDAYVFAKGDVLWKVRAIKEKEAEKVKLRR